MTRFRSRFAVSGVLLAASLLLLALPLAVQAKSTEPVSVKVMSRNMYLGCALEPLVAAVVGGNPEEIVAAATAAWAQLHATDITVRVEALADEILAAQPDLVGLQEVALWRFQFPSDAAGARPKAARKVEFDFLKLLLGALRARGLRYRASCIQEGIDVEMPVMTGEGLLDVRYTDRDVILARNGVAAARRRRGNFEAGLPIPGFEVVRSWTSVDARIHGRKFRFVSLHLEDGFEELQRAQLAEALAETAATDLPLIVAGDFNSDADPAVSYSPAVHADMVAAGFADSWTVTEAGDPGKTWGHSPDLDNPAPDLTMRLDYVFVKNGITVVDADLVGEAAEDIRGGLWPSDHAGLVVELEIP